MATRGPRPRPPRAALSPPCLRPITQDRSLSRTQLPAQTQAWPRPEWGGLGARSLALNRWLRTWWENTVPVTAASRRGLGDFLRRPWRAREARREATGSEEVRTAPSARRSPGCPTRGSPAPLPRCPAPARPPAGLVLAPTHVSSRLPMAGTSSSSMSVWLIVFIKYLDRVSVHF